MKTEVRLGIMVISIINVIITGLAPSLILLDLLMPDWINNGK